VVAHAKYASTTDQNGSLSFMLTARTEERSVHTVMVLHTQVQVPQECMPALTLIRGITFTGDQATTPVTQVNIYTSR